MPHLVSLDLHSTIVEFEEFIGIDLARVYVLHSRSAARPTIDSLMTRLD